ncbi:pseudouridine synthase [Arthrobacter sp.]|uniref:pseudouridine synthase n=1 Tax=Arthrobacter sp. TaxID=1667 RepID=UPI003A9136AB
MTQGSNSGAGRGNQRRSTPGQGGGRGAAGSGRGASGGKSGGSYGAKKQGPAKKGQPGGTPRGPQAFGGERFGRNLGPVKKNRPAPSQRPAQRPAEDQDHDGVRLQKVLANAGVASRRVSEEMITAGRVEVNGEIVTELGIRVDPATTSIHVDGMRIQLNETMRYYAFNKPRGVVSTMEDPEGRPCIADYLRKKSERLFHVGRLDVNTEGLLLLTNDGELANRLTHPSYEVPKTYLVQVPGPMAHGIGAQMKAGIALEDGMAKVDSFKLVDSTPGKVLVEVILHSGKNRIVRRLFDAVGHPVKRLVRVQMGPIKLGDQKQGTIRQLGHHEVGHLLAGVGM